MTATLSALAPKAKQPRNREETEARLLKAGVEVMSALGYEGATTRKIAEAAGANEQLISRYFGGKEGLLIAILRDYREIEMKREWRAGAEPAASLEDEIARFLGSADIEPELMSFSRLALGRAVVDSEVADAINSLRTENYLPLLNERLKTHRALGRIGNGANLERVADVLVFFWLGLSAYGKLLFRLTPRELGGLGRCCAQLIARGLSADTTVRNNRRNTGARET